MRTHKRKKSSRYRGSQTARRGHRKRTKGSGNKGGVGLAGTGKRGDQKKTMVINWTGGGNTYFGKDKTLRAGRKPVKLEVINLNDIVKRYDIKKEINLEGYKVLGEGEVKEKLTVKASAFSESAKEKIEKAGGKAVALLAENEEKVKKPEEKKEAKKL